MAGKGEESASAIAVCGQKVRQLLVNGVVSMGRRNTRPKSYLQVFQWLSSFASVDSRKTSPCLGLIKYGPKDQVFFERLYQMNRLEGCCIDRLSWQGKPAKLILVFCPINNWQ